MPFCVLKLKVKLGFVVGFKLRTFEQFYNTIQGATLRREKTYDFAE